jgi:hypothetical protein
MTDEILDYETVAPSPEAEKCRKLGLNAVQRKNSMNKAYREMLEKRKSDATEIPTE